MNRIIIDAGATKTDFIVINDGVEVAHHIGKGINPNYCSEAEMMQVFADFVPHCPSCSLIEEIQYYGAGCASVSNQLYMQQLMAAFFPVASIQVYSDLLAVCHALSREEKSIVCILGTGSASCLFDGYNLVHRAPSLGYMLGDDGSGTNLGKRLLTAYLNGQLPKDIVQELEKSYEVTFEKVIHRIYKESDPNRFMASFAPFVQEHLNNDRVWKLSEDAFSDFFAKQRIHYPMNELLCWHLSGSVAFHFQEVIRKSAEKQHCKIGKIVASPMTSLVDYYKSI